MSSAPVGTSSPVISRSVRASRRARGTPRVRTPTSARSSTPLLRSTISWAMRVRVRPMRSASMTTGTRAGMCHLFAASQDRVKELRAVYFDSMPVDVEARVIGNTRLSPDYNVIALAAPEIAAAAAPGQFVMVKPGRGADPLLRRRSRCSRSCAIERPRRAAHAAQQAHRRHDGLLFDAVEGDVVSCLGPLGRPFELVDPPARSLDGRRRRRTGAVCHAGRGAPRARHADDALLRRAQRRRAVLSRLVRVARHPSGAGDRGRQPRRHGHGSPPRSSASCSRRAGEQT